MLNCLRKSKEPDLIMKVVVDPGDGGEMSLSPVDTELKESRKGTSIRCSQSECRIEK